MGKYKENIRKLIQLLHINPLNTELNPICHLIALVGAHHILHVSRVRVNEAQSNYIFFYGACSPIAGYGLLILEVSRSHSVTHHSR